MEVSRAFVVKGVIGIFKTTDAPQESLAPSDVQVSFDRYCRSLYVSPGRDGGLPDFTFRLLTRDFMAAAMDNRTADFTVSVTDALIGEVAYISAAAARDYGWRLAQSLLSVHLAGQLRADGLRMALYGHLADPDPRGADPMPERYRHASYRVELTIPWDVMRSLFHDHPDLVEAKYQAANRTQP